MSKVKSVKIVITIGVLVLFKFFTDSIPKISNPLSNTIIFVSFLIAAIIIGTSYLKQNGKKEVEEE